MQCSSRVFHSQNPKNSIIVSMASSISRSLLLRSIYVSITAQCRLTKPSFHSLPASTRPFKPEFCLDNLCRNSPNFAAINFMVLCTTSNQSNSNATGSSEGNSRNNNDGNESEWEHWSHEPKSWNDIFFLLCGGAGLVYFYIWANNLQIEGTPSVREATIGGPFNLIDHNGKAVTQNDFVGKWNLLFFGFTHCPDICPDELQKLAAAIDKIKEKSGLEIVPIFISVDPERDTVEKVREYVKEFHPKLIGITGSPDEIKKAARAYRVYYMKTEEEGSDYLVDHSIVMYLMDPNMQFVKFFGKNVDADSLADGVIQEVNQHKMIKA